VICDACNVRPEWKGEHRCHAPKGDGPRDMMVRGTRFFGECDCRQCTIPTPEKLAAFRKKLEA
jgi:hypothetical protein